MGSDAEGSDRNIYPGFITGVPLDVELCEGFSAADAPCPDEALLCGTIRQCNSSSGPARGTTTIALVRLATEQEAAEAGQPASGWPPPRVQGGDLMQLDGTLAFAIPFALCGSDPGQQWSIFVIIDVDGDGKFDSDCSDCGTTIPTPLEGQDPKSIVIGTGNTACG